MKANELRIGNLIFLGSDVHEVETIEYMDNSLSYRKELGEYAINELAIDNYEPIPLTPEWLERLGFELVNHVHGYSFHHHKQSKLDVYSNKTTWVGVYVGNHCKYVHQLQNLYFALTGSELELKQ